ncbi:MAG: isoprenylcysteine carboxylmethyltransferase family protein [Candidatus Thiodiazotropha sp.]
MKKISVLFYGFINYNLGSSALVYLIAFLFNLIPEVGLLHGIDGGEPGSAWLAAGVNIGLIVLFGFQHSVMARPKFKRWLSGFLPQAAERSTYMMATAAVTHALCLGWQPMPGVVWQAEDSGLYYSLLGLGLSGWVLVLYATFLINHFDLFGLRQVWLYFRGRDYTPMPFKVHSLYRYVRHPIMTGAFIGIWFTPVMTVGHLLFALGMSSYILIGVYHEEKDLVRAFGERYIRYMRTTARFFPAWKVRKGGSVEASV